MSKDVVNFNAGPAGLPRIALETAQAELLDFEGTGISIMEHSHRGKAYDGVHNEAINLIKKLLEVPDTHEVIFIQGGASGVFATLPLNFLGSDKTADYVLTGAWSKKALGEAKTIGEARIAGSGEVDGKFLRIPKSDELDIGPKAAYVHITSNNTIAGTQYTNYPNTGEVPLVADMSSDILSKPIHVSQFSMIYAGAQKNLGPSGVTLAILRKDWAESARTDIPKIFRYQTHIETNSLYHTPPTFSIYLIRNVLRWIESQGGLNAIAKQNKRKAERLYACLDQSDGFYTVPIEAAYRSDMNVVFRLKNTELEKAFLAESEEKGLIGLKGHRSVGGFRASIYNAVSEEGVHRLVDFLHSFRKTH